MLALGLYEGSIGAAGAGTCVHSEVGFILLEFEQKGRERRNLQWKVDNSRIEEYLLARPKVMLGISLYVHSKSPSLLQVDN